VTSSRKGGKGGRGENWGRGAGPSRCGWKERESSGKFCECFARQGKREERDRLAESDRWPQAIGCFLLDGRKEGEGRGLRVRPIDIFEKKKKRSVSAGGRRLRNLSAATKNKGGRAMCFQREKRGGKDFVERKKGKTQEGKRRKSKKKEELPMPASQSSATTSVASEEGGSGEGSRSRIFQGNQSIRTTHS